MTKIRAYWTQALIVFSCNPPSSPSPKWIILLKKIITSSSLYCFFSFACAFYHTECGSEKTVDSKISRVKNDAHIGFYRSKCVLNGPELCKRTVFLRCPVHASRRNVRSTPPHIYRVPDHNRSADASAAYSVGVSFYYQDPSNNPQLRKCSQPLG